ncbi:MAG TPA: hypothetical protein VFG65_09120 [Fimbriimonadales bacterium]|jgi:hypothetical protein|nr:hypothetical protein [Fimbriimonadales bacterium]
MSYGKQSQSSVSKPLIIVLIVVAVIGAIMFAKSRSDASGEETVPGLPKPPPGLQPATPKPGDPTPIGMGGRKR